MIARPRSHTCFTRSIVLLEVTQTFQAFGLYVINSENEEVFTVKIKLGIDANFGRVLAEYG
jgi:hypothetical protein